MYLHKQAYLTKAVDEPDYDQMVTDLDRRNASKEERLAAMRGFGQQRLGVDDLNVLPGYNPAGEYQPAFKLPGERAGYRHQYRFDISDDDLDEALPGVGLYHGITGENEGEVARFIDVVLQNNGAIISTTEKMQAGVPVGGMSPYLDVKTGSGNYFFTRIRELPKDERSISSRGFYFNKRLLRRLDAISYEKDLYGQTSENYPTKYRIHDPEEMMDRVRRPRFDETIFKNSVMLVENLEVIVVQTHDERDEVIDTFHHHSVMELPNDRRIEDAIIVNKWAW